MTRVPSSTLPPPSLSQVARSLKIESAPGVDHLANVRCLVAVENPAALPSGLEIIFANGNESKAQVEAETWCKANPGKRAWVMTATAPSPCVAEMKATWRSE